MEQRSPRKDLTVDNDYLRGVVIGRHQALRWLFGEAWPELKDPDEWEEEMAQEERDFDTTEQAIASLDDLLFPYQEPFAANSESLNGEQALPPTSTANSRRDAIPQMV